MEEATSGPCTRRIDRATSVAVTALLLSGTISFAPTAAGDPYAEHFIDGNALYQQLVRGNAGATGYVIGVSDGVQIAQYHLPTADRLFCTPTVTTGQELARVVREHLKADPTIRTYPAGVLVVRALAAAFPCGRT
jgi:hypothetical protein